MKVELKITASYIKIYINDILHVQIPYYKNLSLDSWKQGKNWYCITISMDGNKLVETWYKERDLWQEILKLIDENIE